MRRPDFRMGVPSAEVTTQVHEPALLALEEGSVFRGVSIGAPGLTSGEVVFNTAMTGYQEILSDPSYARQIVTLTCPHVGNVGANPEDEESARVFSAGLVIRDRSAAVSSWRAEESLSRYLVRQGVPGIAGVDTRRLTRRLRDRGAQRGALLAGPRAGEPSAEAEALAAARAFPGLLGMDLASEVSTSTRYPWDEGPWRLGEGHRVRASAGRFRVVAYDFGIKRNILRLLVEHDCAVTVVPARTPAHEVLELEPDGVFLSNGPGDPEPCGYAIDAISLFLDARVPIFGICLGHQLLALAAGARTAKMKFGHHGANHPVKELASDRVIITSQNHGFAVDESSLPAQVIPTHRSLFDGSLQGIECADRPAFGFQGHPEASPGPHDARPLFEHFRALMVAASRVTPVRGGAAL